MDLSCWRWLPKVVALPVKLLFLLFSSTCFERLTRDRLIFILDREYNTLKGNDSLLGFKIFQKSLNQIFYNFGDAIKLTAVLYLLMTLLNVIISKYMLGILNLDEIQGMKNAEEIALTPQYWLTMLGLIIVNVFFSAWVAVIWHRFMLLGEGPVSFMPTFRADNVLGYIVKSLILGLVLMAAMIPAMIVLVVLGMVSPALMTFAPIFVGMYLVFISFRISLILPAKAIGKEMLVSQSWNATGSAGMAVLLAAILMGVFTAVLQAISQYLITNAVLKLVIGSGIGWISLMLGVSILTTLYGHLVEGRSLD